MIDANKATLSISGKTIRSHIILSPLNDFKWKRRGYSKQANGVVYSLQGFGRNPMLLIRPEPGHWNDARKGHEVYREQEDGWFYIENQHKYSGSWHRIMDPALISMLKDMETNMDAYVASLVVE